MDRKLGSPLHHQLYAVLHSGIMSGRYLNGSKLPSEDELTRQFSVSRATVRRAMLSLETEGLIERHPGRGTLVIFSRPATHSISNMTTQAKLIEQLHKTTSVRLLTFDQAVPPADARDALGMLDGQLTLRIVRVRERKGSPLWLMTVYVSPDIAAQITRKQMERIPLLEALAKAGRPVVRADDQIGATLADPLIARELQVNIGSPLIELARVMQDAQRCNLCYQISLVPPDRHKIRVSVEGGEASGVPPTGWPAEWRAIA
jgi:GntR family transcriptional regulator